MMARPEVSLYGSVDPAPAALETDLESLRFSLIDEDTRMFERMRSLFRLRDIGGASAAMMICEAFASSSALLRHEAAYVLGQMQRPEAVDVLMAILDDEDEHVMVRHEAAEALGAIGELSCIKLLKKHLQHTSPEIAESCEVALDLFDHVGRQSS